MFGKYDKKTFNEIKSQHNIMVLVGNGFDIAHGLSGLFDGKR